MGEHIIWNETSWHKGIFKFIDSLFSDVNDTEVQLELIIPSNVVFRTQMICDYISDELEEDIGIYDLIMLLYCNYINTNIINYDPLKALRELTKDYDEEIKLMSGSDVYIHKKECNRKLVELTISKEDAESGQVLLDELKDLYGEEISLNKMFCNIWLNFIEGYKYGNNKEVLKIIIKMLKEQ